MRRKKLQRISDKTPEEVKEKMRQDTVELIKRAQQQNKEREKKYQRVSNGFRRKKTIDCIQWA